MAPPAARALTPMGGGLDLAPAPAAAITGKKDGAPRETTAGGDGDGDGGGEEVRSLAGVGGGGQRQRTRTRVRARARVDLRMRETRARECKKGLGLWCETHGSSN